jgi:hypothetical protein
MAKSLADTSVVMVTMTREIPWFRGVLGFTLVANE